MTGKRSNGSLSETDAVSAETARISKRFAENTVSLRHRAGRSQAIAAEQAGLHRTEISLLERGLRMPRLDTIVQLAAGVKAEPCDLLAGMAWRIDPSRRPGGAVLPPPGFFEIKVGHRWVKT
jgi:DNA-binding XRE family transcriptional regulator